jgi:hypothetical protein
MVKKVKVIAGDAHEDTANEGRDHDQGRSRARSTR